MIGINAVHLLLHFTPASFSHDFYDLSRLPIKMRSHHKISFSRSRDDCANDQEKESLDKLKFYYKKRTRSRSKTQKICLISWRLGKRIFCFHVYKHSFIRSLRIQHVVLVRSRFSFASWMHSKVIFLKPGSFFFLKERTFFDLEKVFRISCDQIGQ